MTSGNGGKIGFRRRSKNRERLPFVYIRRHGPGGPYRGCYSDDHLAADAGRIAAWLGAGRDVYAYFNNDVEGHAVANARQLLDLLKA